MNDHPLDELPRPTPELVEAYVRQIQPTATKQEVASRVAEVLMTDALGRAIHHGRMPGGLLDLPKCVRISSAEVVQEVPYGYDDPTHPEYACQCEQMAGGLITIMKMLETQDAVQHRIVLPPGQTNHH